MSSSRGMAAAAGFSVATAALVYRWYISKQRQRDRLEASTMPSSPFELVDAWWAEAIKTEGFKARGVVLATSSPNEGATARTLIPHAIGSDGILFGTNSESQKTTQLKEDPRCEMVWRSGHRQIRIRGIAVLGPAAKSREVFDKLTPSFRYGLTMLRQGSPVDESTHDQMLARFDREFTNSPTARSINSSEPPYNYTALVVKPNTFEFYQGGHPGYVNDRFIYTKQDDGSFKLFSRLQA